MERTELTVYQYASRGFTAEGLPIGVQLMGPTNSEGMLISLTADLEAVCG